MVLWSLLATSGHDYGTIVNVLISHDVSFHPVRVPKNPQKSRTVVNGLSGVVHDLTGVVPNSSQHCRHSSGMPSTAILKPTETDFWVWWGNVPEL